MTIPNFQRLMLPVLRTASEGEVRISDVVDTLADTLELSSEDRSLLLPSGTQTVFSNRVHWAKTYLGKAGLVQSTRRAHFVASERGLEVLQGAPSHIDKAFLGRFAEFREFVGKMSVDDTGDISAAATGETKTPEEVVHAAHRQIETSLAEDLLQRIRGAPPDFFERLIVNLLLAMGYGGSVSDAGRALGQSGDNGVDGVIDQDALGLDRVYIQAKRYKEANNIGSGDIRDFFGSLDRHKAAKGLFVTTSAFSPSAMETAEFLSKRIVLIDGRQLTALMIRHNVGVRVEETLYLRKLDEGFFEA